VKVLLVSDVHANLVALEAVLTAAPSVDAIWNLGDTVGYGPRPHECLELLSGLGAAPVLAGNHDLACIGAVDLAEFNPVAQAACRWTAGRLGPEDRAHLAALPSSTTEDGVTLAHASPRDPVWEYVASASIAAANFPLFETRVCFVGHTHRPLRATLDPGTRSVDVYPLGDQETVDLLAGRHLLNPGSVGQPRDGDPRAAFAVLDTDRGTLTARRAAYDVRRTQAQMAAAGLPPVLAARLSRGV